MNDGSFISTESTNRDKAGDLRILTEELLMNAESKISSYNFDAGESEYRD